MGNNDTKPKYQGAPPVRPIEIKTYVMSCQAKMSLYRNKKVNEIRKKKEEIVSALRQNNLDIAKAKMESIIRLEDTITVYDILGPLCEILKERITYLMEANEVPPDIKAQLDTIIYASSRVDIDDLYKLRDLVQRKYGSYYIQAADQNKDGLVNINVIEKLKIKPPVDAFLTIRLKQLCKEKKIKFEFPEEIAPDFNDGMQMNNNCGQNPYAVGNMDGGMGMGGGNNPYNAINLSTNNNMGMGNNPYGPGYGPGNDNFGGSPFSGGNNNMGPGGGDFDAYMKNGGNNNMGGPGGNPYDNNQNNNMGNNPYGGNNNGNPYGDNPYSNNNQGGNPYDNNNQGGNPYDNNNQGGNPYATGDNTGGNPFGDNSGGNPYGGDTSGNPYDSQPK